MRAANKLTAVQISSLNKPGRYGDGGGLWLQVSEVGTKAWLFRYMLDGRPRHMGLGPLQTVSLKDARERAREARRLLLDGIDPIDKRNEARAAARLARARGISFEDCAGKFIEAHSTDWKSEKHREQWAATLKTYAYPAFGKLPVAEVDTALVLKALEPIWTSKPETSSRLRGRIERVLDCARVRGYRSGENPARWRGHLDKLLPAQRKAKRVRHHPALPYTEVPAFMDRLRARESVSARALEFTILTAARTGEVIGAKWAELDLDAKTWVVPAGRMKAGREHRVPLPDRAVQILKKLPREADYVFPGGRERQPIS